MREYIASDAIERVLFSIFTLVGYDIAGVDHMDRIGCLLEGYYADRMGKVFFL